MKVAALRLNTSSKGLHNCVIRATTDGCVDTAELILERPSSEILPEGVVYGTTDRVAARQVEPLFALHIGDSPVSNASSVHRALQRRQIDARLRERNYGALNGILRRT